MLLPKHSTDLSSSSAHVWDPGTHRDAEAHAKGARSVATRARIPPTRERKERERRDRAPSEQAAAAEEGTAPGQQACACGTTRVRTSEGDLHDARPKLAHGGRRGAIRRVAQPEQADVVPAKALDRLVVQ